ncbi:MAG: acetyltransferase [Cyclobacteriaceae bacterium]|nr:acetyltransferase [Cyclobacteriaceae bacterium]UYN85814.1 MAG: acetyltransferase [Cyclobacteriaceae bacterium]
MLVAGASRHAKEVLDILYRQNQTDDLRFFDDIHVNGPNFFYERFPIIHSVKDVQEIFKADNRFILGLGGTNARAVVAKKLLTAGGSLHTVIAESARVGHFQVTIESGVNIMEFVLISSSVVIGEGSLINALAAIHHDVTVGSYCEISPRATLLGGSSVGDFSSVGSGAVILPNIKVGANVIIGAGSVITRDIPDNVVVVGVPGKVIRENSNRAS